MKRTLILTLMLVGLMISCTNIDESTSNDNIQVETDADATNDVTGNAFVDQLDDSFIGEEEYVEIGELV